MASLSDLMKAKATAMALQKNMATTPVAPAMASIATLNETQNQVAAYSPEEPMMDDMTVTDGAIAAYSGEMTIAEDTWTRSDKYLWYEEYFDDKYSTVDEKKNITLHPDQINLSQESSSQFVPFKMKRRYDGVDLMGKSLLVLFENKEGKGQPEVPINVEYNEENIRFGWLVSKNATALVGKIKIEIQAIGTTSKGDEYKWKTKSGEMNILESLAGSGIIEPDSTWLTTFMTQITEQVSKASSAANEASASAARAEEFANVALQAAADSQVTIEEAKTELAASIETEVDEKVATALLDYYTKPEVDTLFENFDISSQLTSIEEEVDDVKAQISNMDGLAKFDVQYDGTTMTFYNGETVMKAIAINSDPSAEWTQSYTASVDEKIKTAKEEVQGNLDTYKTTTDADLKSIHESIDGLPETLASDYYNKEASDEKFALKSDLNATNQTVSGMTASIETNKTNISTVSETLVELQGEVAAIDKSPRVSYNIETNDEQNQVILKEITGEGTEDENSTTKATITLKGGSGGGGGSVLKIEYVTKSPLVVTPNDEAKLTFIFSGTDSSGDEITEGQATIKIGSSIVASQIVTSGENTIDITKYLTVGTQKVLLSVIDDNGSLATKSWTVQKLDVKIESTFNDKLTYPMGTVAFDYTPYGAIAKDVHFVLDGKEIGTVNTSASGIPMGYTIPAQSHGSHLLDVYMTATVNNNPITSNHIVKDILWFDETSNVPVIGCVQQNITALQYDTTNIEYTVYDPTTETPRVILAVDGEVVSTLTMEKNTETWQFKSADVGDHILTITCGDGEYQTVKTINVKVEKLDITIEPVTAGLVVDFNPVGKSNSDSDRVWNNGTYKMTVSDNFDWVNGGYQIDANGDQYFCIKAGTNVEIDYQMFADDAKRNGKEMKLIFKTANVQEANAQFMSCVDNTTGSDHIGVEMFAHEAFIYGSADKLHLKYSENDIIEFEFNITKNTEAVTRITGYEDGCSSRHLVYDDTFNFTQNTPKTIKLGSDKCDLHIYRLKIYNTSLTDRGVLSNFIADARNAADMIDRYNRNQIYDENSQLTPDSLAEACPWLRVYVVSAPYFTKKKSDKVPYATIRQIYKGGDPILDNWVCYDASFSGQGTSSDNYGGSARNLDFIMNKSNQEDKTVKPYFILGDGKTRATEITLSRTSIPNAYYNFKANVASSNHFTNALLAMKYNKFNPYKRPFVREDASIIPYIRDTMEFYNAVVFIQETNEDLSTHREFADCDIHFYSLGNICDSKKTDVSRLTDPSDRYECIVEIMDVDLPLSEWPVNTMINAMGFKKDETTGETIYTWAKDENLGILYELIDGEYVLTTDETVDMSKTYYVDVLENDDFSEDFTYGWRYLWEDGTDEENAEVFKRSRDAWINFYRFVTTSTDEEFKAHFDEYFVKDSAIYYYLFTERFCMTDSRCKNTFWHLAKTGTYRALSKPVKELLHLYCESTDSGYIPTTDTEINPSKTYYTQYAFDLAFDYDNDTAMSLNNYGASIYRHGYEDRDVLDGTTEEVFRESKSTFFCRVRDNFAAERKAMFNELESKNAWHSESFLNEIEDWQNQFPEELWRLDCQKKYVDSYTETFIGQTGDPQFLKNMAQGKMKYTVKQWERGQEAYMASEYQSALAASDDAVLRCTAPEGELVIPKNYKLKLTPYDYMYLNVKYGTQSPIQVRAVPGQTYEIPFEGDSVDIIDIYSASRIQDLGDLSTTYPATVDTSKATRLKELHVGNSTEGYDNPYLTTMTLGANYLLEVLNVENVSGLTQSLNLTALNNLRELYAHGTNAGGVTFAPGGAIQIAELPAITAMSAKNLTYLTDFDIESYDKLTTLTIENCSTIDVINIFELAPNINRVRITGIDWILTDDTLLDRIYAMTGIDLNGYNTTQSVLAGKVHIPIVKQQKLYDFQKAWPDLEITADTIIEQFIITFVNDDGAILEKQYVDKGSNAVDPLKREENPLPTPTKESTISHDFTFDKWDGSLLSVFSDRIITATYTSALRSYTVKYVSKGAVMQESTGLYGEYIPYKGINPVYTGEETGYVYYWFDRWDKSGLIDGDKTINAIFDKCAYSEGYFNGKELKDLRPVEIYAMTKLGLEQSVITDKDEFTFTVGHDVDYDDVESIEVISEKMTFNGTNYYDSGIALFDEDKDFVVAIDYEFLTGCTVNSVLAQCFQANGSNGFKLWYNNGVKLTWGTATSNTTAINEREMVVMRHIKGDQNLYVYNSNLDSTVISMETLGRTKDTIGTSTLVFGSAKADDGAYENNAIGNIHWCKVWYTDLGEDMCKKLALWVHEKLTLEACGFKKYYLTENTSKRCSFSLLASHLLNRNRIFGITQNNSGGWATSSLNSFLNGRFYEAIPDNIKGLLKQVNVPSSVGDKSTEVTTSGCYVTIPAVIEVDSTMTTEPYLYEGTSISYMTSNEARKRSYDGGNVAAYWLRSPNVQHTTYIYTVDTSGKIYGYNYPNSSNGILIELSI